jgi:hypothetical protein
MIPSWAGDICPDTGGTDSTVTPFLSLDTSGFGYYKPPMVLFRLIIQPGCFSAHKGILCFLC